MGNKFEAQQYQILMCFSALTYTKKHLSFFTTISHYVNRISRYIYQILTFHFSARPSYHATTLHVLNMLKFSTDNLMRVKA